MIDISDGLASEAIHLARASNLGVVVYEEKLPLDTITITRAQEFNLDPTTCAMNGGEDYELLFTIPQSEFERVKGHPDLTVIGHMSDKAVGYQLVTRSGQQIGYEGSGLGCFAEYGEEIESLLLPEAVHIPALEPM